jgi:hypothetical protein
LALRPVYDTRRHQAEIEIADLATSIHDARSNATKRI